MAAATAAIAGDGQVALTFHAEPPTRRGNQIRVPPPGPRFAPAEVAQTRGTADSFALLIRHHDEAVHEALAPVGGDARAAYDACEHARVESLGTRRMDGTAANLDAALSRQCTALGYEGVTDREAAPLSWALRFLVRERLTGRPVPGAAKGLVDAWRPVIEEKAGSALSALGRSIADQHAYALAVRQILADLDLEDATSEQAEDQDSRDDPADGADEEVPDESSAGTIETVAGQESIDGQAGAGAEPDALAGGAHGTGGETPGAAAHPWWRDDLGANAREPRYRPFTTEFDEVVSATDLCDAEELSRLRTNLDQQLLQVEGIIARLANRLQRLLLAKQTRAWEFDLDEGVMDSARLARMIANPEHALSFKREKETNLRDTVVTLLLDNSGSMRGRPITIAAMCADVLARTLERCGVKTEILGFTTRAWKGGRSRDQWAAAGKPPEPGRLNDLRHIIYKAAEQPLRRARKNLGLMLREGLLKENIDGEAILWAHGRLVARPEERRILMVISDGAPVDDSTLSTNAGHFLDQHLRAAIRWIEDFSPVELVAIGIGHDVTRYYRRAVTIVDAEQLGGAMIEQLAELFETEPPRRGRRRPRTATVH